MGPRPEGVRGRLAVRVNVCVCVSVSVSASQRSPEGGVQPALRAAATFAPPGVEEREARLIGSAKLIALTAGRRSAWLLCGSSTLPPPLPPRPPPRPLLGQPTPPRPPPLHASGLPFSASIPLLQRINEVLQGLECEVLHGFTQGKAAFPKS